jgi:hypothetical protein
MIVVFLQLINFVYTGYIARLQLGMSAAPGQSRPSHSAPIPANVRYAPDSDRSAAKLACPKSANKRPTHRNRKDRRPGITSAGIRHVWYGPVNERQHGCTMFNRAAVTKILSCVDAPFLAAQ